MAVVVSQGHVVHVQGLVGHGQVPVGGGLAGPVVHLLRDGQLLFVVLDCLRKKLPSFILIKKNISVASLQILKIKLTFMVPLS